MKRRLIAVAAAAAIAVWAAYVSQRSSPSPHLRIAGGSAVFGIALR